MHVDQYCVHNNALSVHCVPYMYMALNVSFVHEFCRHVRVHVRVHVHVHKLVYKNTLYKGVWTRVVGLL